ncbi:MAG TPA: phosphoglucosamine mutase [Nitrospiria bacterium]|nr:phosphoglucosamine mutase [Nitrospiria bacterium]
MKPGRTKKLFGTDGVRGIANQEPMTSEMAMKLGRAAAYLFKNKAGRHRIVIGKDTRLSGYMLESALTSGICSMGVDVLLVGPFPTPGIAFLTRSLRADAGVVISASHNSFEDNGIKFFSRDGLKLPDRMEHEMEELIFSGKIDSIRPTADEIGKAFRVDDAEGRYIEFVKSSLPKGLTLQGLTVVVDCANGAAYKVAPTILRELDAKVIVLGDEPNGMNINQGCGSTHPEVIQKAVREQRADVGVAHDGDADRAIFTCEKGRLVNGDQVMAALAVSLKKMRRLSKNTLVTTVMSNMGLDRAMKTAGIRIVKTAVGDRYVLERMLRDGYNFGGEQSGHLIFLDYNTTGDGLITSLQVLAMMKTTGKPLSELTKVMTNFPQVLVNVRVKERLDLSSLPKVRQHMDKLEKKLDGSGRLLVRYSGTEPLVRIMIEGEREPEIRKWADDLAQTIRNAVGTGG